MVPPQVQLRLSERSIIMDPSLNSAVREPSQNVSSHIIQQISNSSHESSTSTSTSTSSFVPIAHTPELNSNLVIMLPVSGVCAIGTKLEIEDSWLLLLSCRIMRLLTFLDGSLTAEFKLGSIMMLLSLNWTCGGTITQEQSRASFNECKLTLTLSSIVYRLHTGPYQSLCPCLLSCLCFLLTLSSVKLQQAISTLR